VAGLDRFRLLILDDLAYAKDQAETSYQCFSPRFLVDRTHQR
jgi:hypothetical protein